MIEIGTALAAAKACAVFCVGLTGAFVIPALALYAVRIFG